MSRLFPVPVSKDFLAVWVALLPSHSSLFSSSLLLINSSFGVFGGISALQFSKVLYHKLRCLVLAEFLLGKFWEQGNVDIPSMFIGI